MVGWVCLHTITKEWDFLWTSFLSCNATHSVQALSGVFCVALWELVQENVGVVGAVIAVMFSVSKSHVIRQHP